MRPSFLLALCLVPIAGCLNDPAPPAPDDVADETVWMPEWAPVDEATLRPGTNAPGCTFDWVFVDPVAQTYYIGIAAHCTSNPDAEAVDDGTGIRIGHSGASEDETWGTVVYDSDNQTLHDMGVEARVDFALIQLDPGANLFTNPQMMGYEAPVGFISCDETSTGDIIGWHGYGTLFGSIEQTRKREGVLGLCDGRDYGAYTNAVWGDSGSAVVHVASNKALGIVSRLGVLTTPPTELTGATLPYILSELAKHPDYANVHLATIDGGYVGLENP